MRLARSGRPYLFYFLQSRSSDEIPFEAVEVFGLDDAFQIKAVFPVLLHLHAAALPHGGGEAEFVVGEQDLEGVDPVAEGLVQFLQQLVQTIAGLGAGQQDICLLYTSPSPRDRG